MVALLPTPEPQFCDADGNPYAGGTIASYVPGTTTPKSTWVDPGQLAVNTNPIVLDAAGRCIMYGDGDYRLILRDAAGNVIFDQPSSTIVSAAMEPVVSAPTIADALELLGVTDAIATEATARAAADSKEQAARIAADTAETNARIAADSNLQSQIDTINATLSGFTTSVSTIQYGLAYTDSDGHGRITFPVAFVGVPAVHVQIYGPAYTIFSTSLLADTTGFDVYVAYPTTGTGATPSGIQEFVWVAVLNA